MFRALLCPSSGAHDYTDGLSVHVERFIRSNKLLCSIELVLLFSCQRRCTVKHSSKMNVMVWPFHLLMLEWLNQAGMQETWENRDFTDVFGTLMCTRDSIKMGTDRKLTVRIWVGITRRLNVNIISNKHCLWMRPTCTVNFQFLLMAQ